MQNKISTLYMFDIGQGDAFMVDYFSGHRLVVDVGADDKKFMTNLNTYTIRSAVDLLLFSHDDADHAGAITDLYKKLNIGSIIMTPFLYSYIEKIKPFLNRSTNFIKMSEGGSVQIADESLLFLYPYKVHDSFTIRPDNDDSMIFLQSINGRYILFTGDAGFKPEEYLINHIFSRPDKLLDFLKVGHHGSKNSTSDSFLSHTHPVYALISVGKKNTYGHPHASTLARLRKNGVLDSHIFRTDICGTIVFTIYKTGAIGHPSYN